MPAARGAIWSNVSQSARAACREQWDALLGAVDQLPASALSAPTRVGDWSVADLAEHVRSRHPGASNGADPAAFEPAAFEPAAEAARCVEAVLHVLDLASALPDAAGSATPQPPALKASVQLLLAMLAAASPGRSVEVRVPPYAAVQCVSGPRHTRGTPPNVVEADPSTWVELATGRLAWSTATADGRLRASGERADISALLPVLAVH